MFASCRKWLLFAIRAAGMLPLSHEPHQLFSRWQISVRPVAEQIFPELLHFRRHCWPYSWVDGCTTSSGVCKHSSTTIRGTQTHIKPFYCNPKSFLQYGLYSAFMGCFVYTIFGTAKDITLGPTAIMSLLVASKATDIDQPESINVRNAVALTLLSGLVQFIMGICNLGEVLLADCILVFC